MLLVPSSPPSSCVSASSGMSLHFHGHQDHHLKRNQRSKISSKKNLWFSCEVRDVAQNLSPRAVRGAWAVVVLTSVLVGLGDLCQQLHLLGTVLELVGSFPVLAGT